MAPLRANIVAATYSPTQTFAVNTARIVTLREAARHHNPTTAFLLSKCNCTGKCITSRCVCRKTGIECSTHCHGSRTCQNKDTVVPAPSTSKLCRPHGEIDSVADGSMWLTNTHMAAASELLLSSHPHIDDVQNTVLQQNHSWVLPTTEFIQFLHVSNSHWVTISSIGESEHFRFNAGQAFH